MAIEKPVSAVVSYRMALYGGFELRSAGRALGMPAAAQRLLAYLALQDGLVSRQRTAEELWSGRNGPACLRSTLHRIRARAPGAIWTSAHEIDLEDNVEVDVFDEGVISVEELLPGWDEHWVVVERERQRLLMLHRIEARAEAELVAGRPRAAIELAIRATTLEPLRETPHRILVRAHLADGNPSEALRDAARYRELLGSELGLEPTEHLVALLPRPVLPVDNDTRGGRHAGVTVR